MGRCRKCSGMEVMVINRSLVFKSRAMVVPGEQTASQAATHTHAPTHTHTQPVFLLFQTAVFHCDPEVIEQFRERQNA